MQKVDDAIARCFAHHNINGRITIALSGGVDSMVLLDACHQAGRAFSANNASNSPPILDFDAIHVHHGLSPNADSWANFCQAECDKRAIKLNIIRVQINKTNTDGQGVEGVARRERYLAFAEHAAPTLLLGQHADDQAETVIHQLLRGTGLNGLSAMGEAREYAMGKQLLRPFLSLRRADIDDYAREHQLNFIEDESNVDTTYTRNFIRHEVLPLMASRFPQYATALSRTATHAAESAAMLEALAKIDMQWDGATADVAALDTLDLTRQTNALYHWLRWQKISPPSLEQLQEWARQLFRKSPTDKPHQAGGHGVTIVRKKNQLLIKD
jgi:tRNA(Ile)-lysidine synthase